MTLALHENAFVPTLEDMPDAVVASVQPLRVGAVELPHPSCEIRLWRLQQQVIVVRHQDPRVQPPAADGHHTPEDVHKGLPVRVVVHDVRTGVPSRGHMPNRANML